MRYKAAPKPKVKTIGFSQRDWKRIPATSKHNRYCECVNMPKHFTKIGGCHVADGAVRWSHALTRMEEAGQSQTGNKEDWIHALCRSTDKPRVEYCEDQNGTIISIRALQDHRNQSQRVFFETDTVELEWTHFPHGDLFQLLFNPREWSMGRRINV